VLGTIRGPLYITPEIQNLETGEGWQGVPTCIVRADLIVRMVIFAITPTAFILAVLFQRESPDC